VCGTVYIVQAAAAHRDFGPLCARGFASFAARNKTRYSYLLQTKDLGLDLTLESLTQSAKSIETSLGNTKKSINLAGVSSAD
jgi:hypothetical protein